MSTTERHKGTTSLQPILLRALADAVRDGAANIDEFSDRARAAMAHDAIDPDELDDAIRDYWSFYGP